jgi:glucose-6-phosphate 1-epimerase
MSDLLLPEIVRTTQGQGNLPKLEIRTPQASADIYLHGAHITHWQPTGHTQVLFLSTQSKFEPTKAIRGGIPICFPWFGPGPDPAHPITPAHGFARTSEWTLDSVEQNPESVTVTLSLKSSEATRSHWRHDFEANYKVTIGAQLHFELTVTNTGSAPFTFEEALHTYHQVGDATHIKITGLDSVEYLDNRDNLRQKTQQAYIAMDQPVDRFFLDTPATTRIQDPIFHRILQIEKQNSSTTVVWNPGQEGAATFTDMAKEEWKQFACIEAANAKSNAIPLAPGAHHSMSAKISIHPLA